MFEFYVLRYDPNKRRVVDYNIFNNVMVYDHTKKAVRKYLRAPSKYKYEVYSNGKTETTYGFEALCKEIRSILMWQEWARCEYELCVGDPFAHPNDFSSFEITDCFSQCERNIPAIAREVIYQYKQQRSK